MDSSLDTNDQKKSSFKKFHMMAGAVAGITEHLAMYPVDTVKTRMQALSHPGQRLHGLPLNRALQAVLQREGLRGLYGGFGAVAVIAGPAHAIYFSTYEYVKDKLGGNSSGYRPLETGAAGALATIASDTLMNPADIADSPYKNCMDCLVKILRDEGIGTLYRSYKTTLIMNVPYTITHFSVYESSKTFFSGYEEEGLLVQAVSGGMAGAAAAVMTNPLDVVKTRLQLEGVNSAWKYNSSSTINVLRHIVKEEGARALWSGVKARVFFHTPASALCWATYEMMKIAFKDLD